MSTYYYRRRVERLCKLIELKLGELDYALDMYNKRLKQQKKSSRKFYSENQEKMKTYQKNYRKMRQKKK